MLQHKESKAASSLAAPAAPRMPAPKVSVVLPTRNRAHCLGEAIDSIRAQTFQDWELIVVDDGSEDDTGALVRSYCAQDSRIRYVRQPHGGCARALNTGLGLVRGDYLFKMDDDDVAHADLLEICAAGLDAHPDHWAAHFPFSVYRGNHDKGWTFSETTRFEPLFFRVSNLRAFKGWNEVYALFEDSELRIRGCIYRGWRRWYYKEPLYEYRRSDETRSENRVDALTTFGHRYMFRRNEELVRCGLLGRMLGAQTLREAVARLCAAHRRNGFLPSARFAYWQQRALQEIRKEDPDDKFCADVLSLLPGRPRFPWAPLWRAEWALWQRLRLLRMPLSRRVEAMWDLAREDYFQRQEAK